MSFACDFLKGSSSLGILASERQAALFERYMQVLLEWNKRMNLTAITNEADIISKHFLDSLSLLTAVDIQDGAKCIDVGTGAGFPGIPLAIMRDGVSFVLMDSLQKRVAFLNEVIAELKLKNVTAVWARAEEAGQSPEHRQKYDFCFSRAVARMRILAELCLPMVMCGGKWVCSKGADVREELDEARKTVTLLGGKINEAVPAFIPPDITHSIILVDKKAATPKAFPRSFSAISKKALE